MEDTIDSDTVQVSGRGLLHLTVLIENMRREGYELMVGPPKVIEQQVRQTARHTHGHMHRGMGTHTHTTHTRTQHTHARDAVHMPISAHAHARALPCAD